MDGKDDAVEKYFVNLLYFSFLVSNSSVFYPTANETPSSISWACSMQPLTAAFLSLLVPTDWWILRVVVSVGREVPLFDKAN